jgi:hypothetical protein
MNIDFTKFDYDDAVSAAIAAATANPTDLIIVGGIFLSVATIRFSYVIYINRIRSSLERNTRSSPDEINTRSFLEEESSRLSEEELTNLIESVEQHTNNLNSGDSRLREVC